MGLLELQEFGNLSLKVMPNLLVVGSLPILEEVALVPAVKLIPTLTRLILVLYVHVFWK